MLSDLLFRLRALFRRQALEQDLDDELAFHLAKESEKYQRSGAPPDEARRLARLALEGPQQTRERCREARGVEFVTDTLRDIRYGLRQLRRSPGFAVVAVLVVALGIGANTAIFSLLDAVMLKPLPVRDPARLYTLKWKTKTGLGFHGYSSFESCYGADLHSTGAGCSFSYPTFERIRARNDLFSGAAAVAGPAQVDLSGAGAPRMASAELVTGDLFRTLGVHTVLGRTFTPADDTPNADPVAILSYSFWQAAFGSDPSAVGKTVRLNRLPFLIIGVTQPEFTRLSPGRVHNLWLPLHAGKRLGVGWVNTSNDYASESYAWLTVLVRLRDGMTQTHAQQAASQLFADDLVHGSKIAKPESRPSLDLINADLGLTGVREDLAKPLSILMWAVGIVLLIACANLAGLLMARAAARRREMSIRVAIGANRARIFRQLLTESLVLSVAGGALGVVLAYWGAHSLETFLDGAREQTRLDLQPDLRVLLYTTLISILSGLLFGVLPAWRGASRNPKPNSYSRSRVGSGLVVLQVALSIVLVCGAGLLMRTLSNLHSINPGFDTGNLLLFGIDPTLNGYQAGRARYLLRDLRSQLTRLPGVRHVTYSSDALLAGSIWGSSVTIDGSAAKQDLHVSMLGVGLDFFETMRIPLLAGRPFTPHEVDSAAPVVAVNREFVEKYRPAQNPIGLHLSNAKWEVIAVVGNARYQGLRDEIKPTLYLPFEGLRDAHFEIRSAVPPETLLPDVRRIVRKLDDNLPLFDIRTQAQQIDQILFAERLVMRLASCFGLLALTLTCVGVYGLFSYEVARRTRETGIRIAVGAQPGRVVASIMRETLILVILGVLLGIPASIAVTGALTALLYGVRPADPYVLAGAALLLIGVAALAGYLPARRASQIDPMVALRYD